MSKVAKLLLVLNTVKYLKFSQVYYRILKRFIHPKVHQLTATLAKQNGPWVTQILNEQKLFADDQVCFLNHEGSIALPSDWTTPSQEKLWLYNLHYFDDLTAVDCEVRTQLHLNLINRWIDENPPGKGDGWEPYPISLRVVNWIKSFLSHIEPNQVMLDSLAQQADYLAQDLEVHILGNHLFVNAKALIFAGIYLDDDNSRKWLETGLNIYMRELEEQILPDGGNFELTPMYHVIMLIDLLDLLNLFAAFSGRVNAKVVTRTSEKAQAMLSWLAAMSHHDDKLSFFNDCTWGIAPDNRIVRNYAEQLGLTPAPSATGFTACELQDTGYVSVKGDEFSLIADLGKVGPDYQPGHAHADTLSYELQVKGQRFFVNSGIREYGVSASRLAQRKTDTHNTVSVNGLDSSQVWSGFRVAKRAKIERYAFWSDDSQQQAQFHAAHNGFKRQGVKCLHQRSWQVSANTISITDELIGTFKGAQGFLHLHPSVKIVSLSDEMVILSANNVELLLVVSDAQITVADSHWYPYFGQSEANKKLCFTFKSNTMRSEISWS